MSNLKVRKLEFRFDEDISFQWNLGNPSCGNLFNMITFIGPCFERYFIKPVIEAIPLIESTSLRADGTGKLTCQYRV